MNAFEAYQKFLAVKSHFTQKNYDFVKYNGKVKANPNSFENRKDKFQFEKLAKKFKNKDKQLVPFLVANFTRRNISWIGDLTNDEESDRVYDDWKKVHQSLTYTFKEDMKKVKNDIDINNMSFDDLFKISGSLPVIVKYYSEGYISLESLIIFMMTINCLQYFNNMVEDDYLWPDMSLKFRKYMSFMNIDKKYTKKIMRDIFVYK